MNIRNFGRAWRLVDAVVLLSLVLVLLPAPALAQTEPPATAQPAQTVEPATVGPTSTAAPAIPPEPKHVTKQAVPAPEAPAAPADLMDPTEPAKDCDDPSRPASAQHILVYPEQEVGVTYKAGSDRQEYIYYDYSSGTLVNRVLGPQSHQAGAFDWGHGVAADINADGNDEIVQAGRVDSNNQLTVQTFVYGPDYAQSRAGSSWFAQDARLNGDNIQWIDIAAGNFQHHGNGQRDIVVVLRNDDNDLEVIPFFASGLTLTPGQSFHDAMDGRESVWHVSGATGDLTGNGYDDDIVAAFKDGGNHLQVLVLHWENGTLNKLADLRFVDPAISHYAQNVAHDGDYNEPPQHNGIDVTTGDVDGDGKDEAVVAFVDDKNHAQVMALGLSPATSGDTPYVLNDEGFYYANPDTKDPRWISVAAPDLNGDGIDEILMAFGARYNCCSGDTPAQVWRLSYAPWVDDPNYSSDQGTMLNRDLVWKDRASYDADEYNNATVGSIEKVNLDGGVRERAILAFNGGHGPNDRIQTRVLDSTGDAKSLKIAASASYDASADTNYDVTAITGDVNHDSRWLTYTGACKQYGISSVATVLNMPPIWYEKNEPHTAIGSALGRSVSNSTSMGETTTIKYGASYTIDGSLSLADIIEVGPKIQGCVRGQPCSLRGGEAGDQYGDEDQRVFRVQYDLGDGAAGYPQLPRLRVQGRQHRKAGAGAGTRRHLRVSRRDGGVETEAG